MDDDAGVLTHSIAEITLAALDYQTAMPNNCEDVAGIASEDRTVNTIEKRMLSTLTCI